jgi:tetratricopeptide (TPR) repeat protein
MRWLAIAALLIAARASAAPGAEPGADPGAGTAAQHLARVRALYDKGDFVHARDELLAAYRLEARPELLFALGQVELNLGRFQIAIEYYERFLASRPDADQAALAQQAIGAARARLTEKPPVIRPQVPPHRAWETEDEGLAALGATLLLAGTGLLTYDHALTGERSGTLSAYDDRLSRASVAQWVGAGCLAAGAIALGSAMVRWRLHLVDGELQPIAAPSTAGLSWVQRW